jgi:predicted nucleic acid-binding protein
MLDFNVQTQIDFLKWINDKGVVIYEIQQKDIQRIIELSVKYSDIPMDFADATLVIAAEQTGIRKIISIDSDFEIYRLPSKEMIENIFM